MPWIKGRKENASYLNVNNFIGQGLITRRQNIQLLSSGSLNEKPGKAGFLCLSGQQDYPPLADDQKGWFKQKSLVRTLCARVFCFSAFGSKLPTLQNKKTLTTVKAFLLVGTTRLAALIL